MAGLKSSIAWRWREGLEALAARREAGGSLQAPGGTWRPLLSGRHSPTVKHHKTDTNQDTVE